MSKRTNMKLVFNPATVQSLVIHAMASPSHETVPEHGVSGPALLLVKDEGIYLMSNGLPRQQPPLAKRRDPDQRTAVYAESFGPLAQDNDTGPNFIETIPLSDELVQQFATAAGTMQMFVKLTDNQILLGFEKLCARPRQRKTRRSRSHRPPVKRAVATC